MTFKGKMINFKGIKYPTKEERVKGKCKEIVHFICSFLKVIEKPNFLDVNLYKVRDNLYLLSIISHIHT